MEFTFNIGDLITIGGVVLAIAGGWFKMRHDKEKLEIKIQAIETDSEKQEGKFKEEVLSASQSRRSIRKQMIEGDKETVTLMNGRVDKLQSELKEERNNNKQEFKEINSKLNEINGGIGELKGLIQNK